MTVPPSCRWRCEGFILCLMAAVLSLARPLRAQGEGKYQILQFRTLDAERYTVMEHGGYWPSAALLKNGELIVVARSGAHHEVTRGSNLVLARSTDLGKTWSEPVWIAASRPNEDLRDAFITELKSGTLLMAFHIYRFTSATDYDSEHVNAYVTRSEDGGRTWSVPDLVNVAPYTFASPHRRIVELPSGTLLMVSSSAYAQIPMWGDIFRAGAQRGFQSVVFRSHDGGRTWGEPSRISDGDETCLLRLPSGKILAAVRGGPVEGSFRRVRMHESLDDGRTWRDLGPVTESSELPGSLLLLRDGRILLSYGDRRAPLFGVQAVVSRDEGRTWDREHRFQVVGDAPNWDCGYPDSIQLPDGRIFTVYYQVADRAKAPDSTVARAVVWTLPN